MLEQFQNLLESPRASHDDLLKHTQDLVLNALEGMFPAEYDFTDLAKLYENQTITSSQSMLTYHLVKYFIQVLSENFISIHSYESLESQTQKLEANIRSHIKLEQEVKMYLEHLEGKIAKYENYIQYYINSQKQIESRKSLEEDFPNNRETTLLKQRLSLIRRNEKLMNKLSEREEELRKMNKLNSSHIEIMENFMEKDKLVASKSENKISHVRMLSQSKSSKAGNVEDSIFKKLKTPSKQEAILIRINGNNNQVNYYLKK